MDLDDVKSFDAIDHSHMIDEIRGLPAQLEIAWQTGMAGSFTKPDGLRAVLISGMGGSAIGADLLSAYVQDQCPVPVVVQRDYGLPAWAKGQEVLVIASSHSGNTEETLSAFDEALARQCRVLALSTGGTLMERAVRQKVPVWKFEHEGQPRAAVGYSFGLLLAAMYRAGLVADPEAEIKATVALMETYQKMLEPAVPIVQNPAKRLAGQLVGRLALTVGSGLLVPVARRWKGQLNELAKSFGSFDALPEVDHNTVAGVLNPEKGLSQLMALFLRYPSEHPRNKKRSQITQKLFMEEGINTDSYMAQGESPMEQMWSAITFGDYLAYYLAMAYEVDPTPIEVISRLKAAMQG
ncbi:MAG TPA: bifunctional phosphoglucose/phosphomannose isomerase [Longilinea sp.]|nr:bifunctional phosphoglucose/phosphomannose isomerase [Longilinea sp.]